MMSDAQSIDLRETGAGDAASNQRLYMQLTVFHESVDSAFAIESLEQTGTAAVLYESLHDPRGIGVLSWSTDPAYFVNELRRLYLGEPFIRFEVRTAQCMFGRTYAIGYERDLQDVLIDRPVARVLDEKSDWAVWYPLRRTGAFAQLPEADQKRMLGEHGAIGRKFAEAGHMYDIRLACHGLDQADNDFVVGLIGSDPAALSKCVEAMRSTQQTSQYIESLGPFFVGKRVWGSGG